MKKKNLGLKSAVIAALAAAVTVMYAQVEEEDPNPSEPVKAIYAYKVFKTDGDEDAERKINALSSRGWRLTKVAVEDGSALLTVFMEKEQ